LCFLGFRESRDSKPRNCILHLIQVFLHLKTEKARLSSIPHFLCLTQWLRMLRTTLTFGFALVLALLVPAVLACDVPVFRYALDHWPADTFLLEAPPAVLRAEPLATEFRNLGDSSGLNLQAAVSSNGCRL